MEIVPSDSIVAILSTSHLLAGSRKSSPIINKPLTAPAAPPSSLSPSPSSHLGHNPGGQTSRDTSTRTDSSSGSNRTDNEDEEIITDPDVFVAYERLRTGLASSACSQARRADNTVSSPRSTNIGHAVSSPCDTSEGGASEGDSERLEDDEGTGTTPIKQSETPKVGNRKGDPGLVIFVPPTTFTSAADKREEQECEDFLKNCGDITATRSGNNNSVRDERVNDPDSRRTRSEAETQELSGKATAQAVGDTSGPTVRFGKQSGEHPSTSAPQLKNRAGPVTRISRLRDIAPMPLLVFDTDTFSALGTLDERFMFGGTVAEWVTRASVRFTITLSTNDTYSNSSGDSHIPECARCPLAPIDNNDHNTDRRRRRKRRKTIQDTGYEWYDIEDLTPLGISQKTAQGEEEGPVVCVHRSEWGRRFLRPWTVESYCGDQEQPSTTKRDVKDDGHDSAMSSPAIRAKAETADTIGGSCSTTPHPKRECVTYNLTRVDSTPARTGNSDGYVTS